MVVEMKIPACDDSRKKSVHLHFPNSNKSAATHKTIGTVRAPAPIQESHSEMEWIGS
jgi:hypothetical protein